MLVCLVYGSRMQHTCGLGQQIAVCVRPCGQVKHARLCRDGQREARQDKFGRAYFEVAQRRGEHIMLIANVMAGRMLREAFVRGRSAAVSACVGRVV